MIELREGLIKRIMEHPEYRAQLDGSGTEKEYRDYVNEQVAEMGQRQARMQEIDNKLAELVPQRDTFYQDVKGEIDALFRVGKTLGEHPELQEYVANEVHKIAPNRENLKTKVQGVEEFQNEKNQLLELQVKQFERLMDMEVSKLADIQRQIMEKESQGVEVG